MHIKQEVVQEPGIRPKLNKLTKKRRRPETPEDIQDENQLSTIDERVKRLKTTITCSTPPSIEPKLPPLTPESLVDDLDDDDDSFHQYNSHLVNSTHASPGQTRLLSSDGSDEDDMIERKDSRTTGLTSNIKFDDYDIHQRHDRNIANKENHHDEKSQKNHREVANSEDRQTLSSLFDLIRSGSYEEFVKFSIRKKLNRDILNVFVDGQTAYHYALLCGRDSNWCKDLISYGSNPNLMNRDGWHPIHLAAYSGCRETMLYLIDLHGDQ